MGPKIPRSGTPTSHLSGPSLAPPVSVTLCFGEPSGPGTRETLGPVRVFWLEARGRLRHAHATRAATRSPYMLPTDGGRPHPGPPEGQVITLADAEPLTWAGAGPLTWAGAWPRAGGAGPHQSCSNPRPTRPRSEAAADAEPVAARAPGAPPPPAGTSGTALGRVEDPMSRCSCGTWRPRT